MKSLNFLFLFIVAVVSFGFSQDCQTASAVPAKQVKLASGRIFLEFDGAPLINGGPEVYTKLTNVSTSEVAVMVEMDEQRKGANTYSRNCLYIAKLASKTSSVVRGSSSEKSPVQWRVSVSFGPGSGEPGEALGWEVYSNPPKSKANPPKK